MGRDGDAAAERRKQDQRILDQLNKKAGKKTFSFTYTLKLDRFFRWLKGILTRKG